MEDNMKEKSLALKGDLSKTKRNELFFKYGLWIILINFFTATLLFFVASKATLSYSVFAPFAFAILFALIWCKYNIINVSLAYISAYSLAGFSLNSLYISLGTVGVALIVWLIHNRLHKPINRIFIGIYALLSQWAYIWLQIGDTSKTISLCISVALGMFFLYACLHFFNATVIKKFNQKLTYDEIICGCIVVAIIGMGLSNIPLWGIEPVKLVVALAVLVSTYLFKGNAPILVSISLGVGASLHTGNISYIASFAIFSLVAMAFKTNHRIFSAVGIILVEVLFGLYFECYPVFSSLSIVSVAIGSVIFLFLPLNMFMKVLDMLGGYREKVAIRNIINRSKQGICKRMNEISDVFLEMDKVFRGMVRGVMPEIEAKKMTAQDIVDRCCKDCPEKNKCLRVNGKYTTEIFDNLINSAFERGKATLLDLPQYLSTKCGRVNTLISTANQSLASYKHYSSMVYNMDSSRILIADQLNGISGILKKLSDEVSTNVSFDVDRENRIIEELGFKNIFCVEAVVYEENPWKRSATLVLRNDNLNNKLVEKLVSKVCGGRMSVINSSPADIPNSTIITLKSCANYDIVFGQSSCSKTGILQSGDTHALTKIDDSKYMVAICDGMGSGERAERDSSLAISLIENFYKAGFDNEIILNSVNKLLSLNNEESFSALDVCVIDTRQNTCDFIKLGAPYGFIKHKFGTDTIESYGLPIGVLEEIQPRITKTVIQDFDNIVLVSDGITDAFGTKDEFCNFINNLENTNPQTISDRF